MHSRLIVVAAAVCAAAFPVSTASAKPEGKGKPDKSEKHDKSDKQDNSGKKNEAAKVERVKPDHPGNAAMGQNLLLKGTVSAVDVAGGLVTVTVTSGNHAAQALAGESIQFNVSSAIQQITDSTGDGTADLNDVVVGDEVMVHAHVVSEGAELVSGAAQPYTAKQFNDSDVDTPVPDPLPVVEGTTP